MSRPELAPQLLDARAPARPFVVVCRRSRPAWCSRSGLSPMTISAVAARLQAATFLEYARSIGWVIDEQAVLFLEGRPLGKFVAERCAKAPVSVRDRVHEDFERVRKLAKEKSGTAIRDAVGPPGEVSAALEPLASDEGRALWLLVHHRDTIFEQAEHAAAYSARVGSRTKWLGYHLKPFSRDWTPDGIDLAAVGTKLAEAVRNREGEDRHIEIEVLQRPATPDGWNGPAYWQFSVSISQRETRREQWVGAELTVHPVVDNRRIELAVTPGAKTIQAVRDGLDAQLLGELVQVFAETALGQTGPLEPYQHREYKLAHLKLRPVFDLHPEHGIASVKVSKLVVGAGAGTATYWSGARSEVDAYDVAAAATGKHVDKAIGRRPVRAATIRVEFKPRHGKRTPVVSFEMSLPNKCDLREENELERLIIENYLVDWGFLITPAEPPDDGDAT